MTKTLTEQWREGTLPRGAYYVNRLNEIRIYLVTYEDDKNTHEIYEIIAPVPSYDEWKELKEQRDWYETRTYERAALINELRKQLAIATKALKEINKNYRFTVAQDVVYKALKEMKGVK